MGAVCAAQRKGGRQRTFLRSWHLRAVAIVRNGSLGAAVCAGVWQGVLRNAAGAPIPGAKVRLAGKGAATEAVTGTDGAFRLRASACRPVPPDRSGERPQGRTTRSPSTWNRPRRRLRLPSPTAVNSPLPRSRARPRRAAKQLSSQAVSELPLNKRDFSTLLLLAAGTMTDANGATNFTAQFAINGQRGVEAIFAMDGADISDPEMGGATFSNFNVDAVEEIQSSSGWMPAEIGRGAAGFTNIITRSGASGFHGSFFEFVRNSAFDARNYFDHATPAYPGRIPPFRRNEFGFTNGGPVFIPHVYDGRKRTFYFTQYQGFRQVLGTTQVMPVPTATERAGQDTVTYPDGSADTLTVPVDPGIAASAGALSAAEPSRRLLPGAHLRNCVEGSDQCRPVLSAHRSQDFGEGPVLCALHLRQSERSHHQSRPDGHRSFFWCRIH